MKTIILFSLAFILGIFPVNSAPAPILDAFGKDLRAGVKYYVLPAAAYGEYGGLLLAKVGNKSCPAGVAQSRGDDNGLSLTFTLVNPKKGVIRVSTDVNIKFSGSNSCHESNVWKLKYDKAMKQYAVMGVEGNPGPETLDNWFKIEKSSYAGYNCKVMCRDIGLVLDEHGAQRLALSDDPSSVNFYGI
ncbi:hypothetical protein L1987_42224 [Smallanthus sonchifolius]|uniref:Uncharacterized protein n=1 Tax=Smallanthus sonchifolius TaxID=185202 RepID=A0ACB9GX05_9ASTR|nr:hypothetical protein L1987_42224 [Smallanthus sonchifolius]